MVPEAVRGAKMWNTPWLQSGLRATVWSSVVFKLQTAVVWLATFFLYDTNQENGVGGLNTSPLRLLASYIHAQTAMATARTPILRQLTRLRDHIVLQ